MHSAYTNNSVGIIWFLRLSGTCSDLEIGDTAPEILRFDNLDGGEFGSKILNFRILSVLELCPSLLCLSVISTLDDSCFCTDDVPGTLSIFGKSGKRP
jgi:hypothetical protein